MEDIFHLILDIMCCFPKNHPYFVNKQTGSNTYTWSIPLNSTYNFCFLKVISRRYHSGFVISHQTICSGVMNRFSLQKEIKHFITFIGFKLSFWYRKNYHQLMAINWFEQTALSHDFVISFRSHTTKKLYHITTTSIKLPVKLIEN